MADRFNVLFPRVAPRSLVDPTGATRAAELARESIGTKSPPGLSFDDIIKGEVGGGRVRFSPDAQEKVRKLGIPMGPVEMDSLARGLEKAARSGGRECLLMGRQAAFVAHVPEREIISVIGPDEMKDHVFTRIDSALLLDV